MSAIQTNPPPPSFRDRLGDLFTYGAAAWIDSNVQPPYRVNDPYPRSSTTTGASFQAGQSAPSIGAAVASVPQWAWLAVAVAVVVVALRK